MCTFKIIFLFVVLSFCSTSHAGVEYGGVCYADLNVASAAVQSGYPKIEGNYLVRPSVTVFSIPFNQIKITWWRQDTMTGAQSTGPALTVGLSSCDSGTVLNGYPVQDILFVSVLVVSSILGFVSGRMR